MLAFCCHNKGMLPPRLQTMVTYVNRQERCNFHGMVQCYGQMLHIALCYAVIYLHLVNSSQMALVLQRNS